MSPNIILSVFRSNREYKLVPYGNLTKGQRKTLSDLCQSMDFHSVLFPVNNQNLSIKAICRKTAIIFEKLQQPGLLPDQFITSHNESESIIEKLVLDSILEIELNGSFISGPSAFQYFTINNEKTSKNIISKLSINALKYAQELDLMDSSLLSLRLYNYNRCPLNPWDCQAIEREQHLFGDKEVLYGKWNTDKWTKIDIAPKYQDYWVVWKLLNHHKEINDRVYKLYISLPLNTLLEIFGKIMNVLAETNVISIKVGTTLGNLLRSDKFMAYFNNTKDLRLASEKLERVLKGVKAQGVPFTAQIAKNGVLSWGVDPPSDNNRSDQSWRSWITIQLSNALITAKRVKNLNIEPWEYALNRLQLEGVDTDTWIPSKNIWNNNE